jgi:aminopeptidase N
MLRTLLGDTRFFQACRNYLNDTALAYKAASTSDLQRHMEGQFGVSMAPFFNTWIYGFGTPSYTVNWYTSGNNITVKLNQTRTTGSSVTHFPMPVVLRVTGSGSNLTNLILYDRGDSIFVAGNGISTGFAGRVANFNLSFAPTAVSFDPDNVTMATGTLTKSTTPLVRTASPELFRDELKVFPNPVSNELLLMRNKSTDNCLINVYDLSGKLVYTATGKQSVEKIRVEDWKSGTYILQVTVNEETVANEKFVVVH